MTDAVKEVARYCETCDAPRRDGVAIMARCGLCRVINGQLPPTKYRAIEQALKEKNHD